MNIHEYQAKAVLREFGVPVPRGVPAFSVDEAVNSGKDLGGPVWVVKAQIHAGGRGKGGGVKLAKSPTEAEKIASDIIGMTLVTHQTGPEGRVVARVLIERDEKGAFIATAGGFNESAREGGLAAARAAGNQDIGTAIKTPVEHRIQALDAGGDSLVERLRLGMDSV